jgi:phosphodiesterase/alkaline phosphatase D-like protein
MTKPTRRALISGALGLSAGVALGRPGWVGGLLSELSASPQRHAAAWLSPEAQRPLALWGVMSGEVSPQRAVVWSKSDRPATFKLFWSLDPDFKVVHCA